MNNAKEVLLSAESMLGIGYWHYDLETQETIISDRAISILGNQSLEEQASLELLKECFLEHDKADFLKSIETASKGATPHQFDGKIKTSSGDSRLVRISLKPHVDETGKIDKVIGFIQDISLESRRIEDLIESHKLLEATSSIAHIGHWRLDLIDHELFWSDEVYRIHGYEPGEIRPTLEDGLNFYHPEDRERVLSIVESSLATGKPFEFEARIIRPDETIRHVQSRGLLHTEKGKNTVLFGVFQDISEQVDFREQSLMWRYLVNASPEAIIITNDSGKIIWVNKSCEQLTGYTLNEMIGLKPGTLLQGPDTDPETIRQLGDAVRETVPITVEIQNYSKVGAPYWVMLSIFPRFDDTGTLKQYMAIQIDVTERIESQQKLAQKQKELEITNFQINRQRAAAEDLVQKESLARKKLEEEIEKSQELQDQLRKMANQDELTGLPNRRYFLKRSEAEFQRAKRYRNNMCLIMCDIDHFKQVNDNFGHIIGDEALRKVTQMMTSCLRDNIDLIGRMGGEEFCIALPETTLDEAETVAERIRDAVEKTSITNTLSVTCSFGISSVDSADSLEGAISHADIALYKSKTNGRNQVSSHTE